MGACISAAEGKGSTASALSSVTQIIEVPISEFRTAIYNALRSQNHNGEDSNIVTDTIMYAELRSNNQGIVKLLSNALRPTYVGDEVPSMKTMYETKLSAKIDGAQRIGMVVLKHCVDIAIAKAEVHGMSVVGCNNYSSATGALGCWAKKIAEHNLIGIVLSQCPEMVAPHGSYGKLFGTNPIAIGLPTTPRHQVLDMATSASSWYGLVTAKEKGEKIPADIAYDSNGCHTESAAEALNGALRSFDRSFKGSHLALMVELLAGALTGASMNDKGASKNWGSLVIAIDPSLFGPIENFQLNASIMCSRVKQSKPLPGFSSIVLPGERGDEVHAKNVEKGTIAIDKNMYNKLIMMYKET